MLPLGGQLEGLLFTQVLQDGAAHRNQLQLQGKKGTYKEPLLFAA